MDEMEMAAAAEALEEIAKVLDRHSMRKPQQEETVEGEPEADLSIEIEAEGPPMEMEEESPVDMDAVAREELGDDAPVSIMSYDSAPRRKGPPQRSAPPPPPAPVEAPVKRGRGRPKKVY
jgi:hypothetical protein